MDTRNDIESLNRLVERLTTRVRELRADNDALRAENYELAMELEDAMQIAEAFRELMIRNQAAETAAGAARALDGETAQHSN